MPDWTILWTIYLRPPRPNENRHPEEEEEERDYGFGFATYLFGKRVGSFLRPGTDRPDNDQPSSRVVQAPQIPRLPRSTLLSKINIRNQWPK